MDPSKLTFPRQVDFIPVGSFLGMGGPPTITIVGGDASITAIGLADDADNASLAKTAATNRTGIQGVQPPASAGAGIPVMREMSNGGICGLFMEAAGDDVAHFMRIPNNWDRRQDIYVRAVWTSASTTANDGITWKFLYTPLILSTAANLVSTVPATALDTEIPEDEVSTTAYTPQVTPNGILNGGTLLDTQTYIKFLMEMQAFDAGLTEDKFLLGVEFEYTMRFGDQHGLKGRSWSAS